MWLLFLGTWEGNYDLQCPIDRASHTQPLVSLLGAEAERGVEQGIKT